VSGAAGRVESLCGVSTVTTYRFCPACAAALVPGLHGDRRRLACAACGWVHWDNPTPVVAAIIELDGKLLLARNRAWPEKVFALVTGFLERDEHPAAAVLREVKEETDLDAGGASLVGVCDFARMNQVILGYHVVARGAVRLSDELAEYRLIEPARVRPWRQGTGVLLADWLSRRGLPVHFLD
jgi:NADH pyrophosphatase NudC (nudix superfamily)